MIVKRNAFEVRPPSIDAGSLSGTGSTLVYFDLYNTGDTAQRFVIKNVPHDGAASCRVTHFERGPIAAGLKRTCEIEVTFPGDKDDAPEVLEVEIFGGDEFEKHSVVLPILVTREGEETWLRVPTGDAMVGSETIGEGEEEERED